MPTYDFRCPKGHVFEEMQPSSAPNPPCPYAEGPCPPTHVDHNHTGCSWPSCPPCGEPTVKVPSFRGNVIGNTPKFYPNRG